MTVTSIIKSLIDAEIKSEIKNDGYVDFRLDKLESLDIEIENIIERLGSNIILII